MIKTKNGDNLNKKKERKLKLIHYGSFVLKWSSVNVHLTSKQ